MHILAAVKYKHHCCSSSGIGFKNHLLLLLLLSLCFHEHESVMSCLSLSSELLLDQSWVSVLWLFVVVVCCDNVCAIRYIGFVDAQGHCIWVHLFSLLQTAKDCPKDSCQFLSSLFLFQSVKVLSGYFQNV